MLEDEGKERHDLNRELLLLKTDLAETSLKYRKRFAELKARTKRLLEKLNSKEM